MIKTHTHKSHLLHLLGEGQVEEALDALDHMLLHGRLYPDLVHYKARYREIQAGKNKGLLKHPDALDRMSEFTHGLIAFVAELDERELINPILLLSPDQAAHDKLAESFKRFFPYTSENCSGVFEKGDFACVVCNDFYTDPAQQAMFDALMQQYLDARYYLVCFTGSNQKEIVGKNRLKVHAANSPFALYARVREMIDFIRYFPATTAE